LVLAASMLGAGASVASAAGLSKKPQTITFTSAPPGSATAGGPTYTVTATATSGNPVTFTIDPATSSVCTISGPVVSFTGAGPCTIDANQAGNSEYKKARQAQQSFPVGKGAQTITFTSPAPSPATVGGPGYTVSATGGPSGNPVTFTIDPASTSVCAVSGSTVSFSATGPCTIDANQAGSASYEPAPQAQQSFTVSAGTQAITFTSAAPSSATAGGPAYNVKAAGGASGNPVTFTVDLASTSVCTISGSTVSFVGTGTCTVDANQAGNADYAPAAQAQQSFAVGRGAQTITFRSVRPSSATVNGPTYTVLAAGGESQNPVTFTIDPASSSVCTISGSTVSFVGTGTCTIDANQAGNSDYEPAHQAQQSFTVAVVLASARPSPIGSSGVAQVRFVLLPNSTFRVLGASLSLASFAITFKGSVTDPGTFKWVLTFRNRQFGVFSARNKKCKAGLIRLKGRCRPAMVLFAKGSETVAAPGNVSFTVKPTASAVRAIKNAFKKEKALPVSARITFQSARGGSPVALVQSLLVKMRR
jgi:hypothetical protein